MFREIFFWFTEYLNYFALIFFGIKLFLKKYDVQTGRKEWVENVIILVASVPVVWFCADNYRFSTYSNGVTYVMVLYMILFIAMYCKKLIKGITAMVAIYIHVTRLVDLLLVAISMEVSHVSRYYHWNFIDMGMERSLFLISLSVGYYLFYRILRRSYLMDYLQENYMYRWGLCLYSFLGIMCFCRVYRFDYTQETIKYWTFYLVCAFIMFGFFIFYFVSVKAEEKNKILNLRNDMLESNYITLQKVYDENRMLSHDFKNHMLAINQLMKNEDYDLAEEYIDKYIECLKETKNKIESGCKIIDIILNFKIAEASDKKINFKYKIDYIGNISFEDIDMCSLLANLLDNAIEACEKVYEDKWIEIQIKRKNDTLIIIINNSINQKQNNKKNFFVTDKLNPQMHGLGLRSIENVIKKYQGYKDFKIDHKSFNVFISLPID